MNGIERNIKDIYQDVPDTRGNIELVSSIGGLWPPEQASFDRIKGIYTPEIIGEERKLVDFLATLEQYASSPDFGKNVTRISLRAVMTYEVLLRSRNLLGSYLEAIIPLNSTQPVFANTALVYVGKNHETRQPNLEEVGEYIRGVLQVCSEQKRRSVKEIMERPLRAGYKIGIIVLPEDGSAERERIISQIYALYRRFGWERGEVEAILVNPNNIIGVAIYNQEIVSAGIAEMAQIPVGENTLRIVELTEAATRSDHARNGLYTAVSTALLLNLAARSQAKEILEGEVDIIFGECNGNAFGVLKTAKIQGRTFALEVGKRFGYPESGMLPQHVPISGGQRITPYNDLFPAFLVRESLYNFYGGGL